MERKERIYDIFRYIERKIDRLVERALEFQEHSMWDFERGELEPLAEIQETEEGYIVTIDLPLVEKESLSLKATEDSIEVVANLRRCVRYERWGVVQKDCLFKSYRKIIRFPAKINPKEAKAVFRESVLRIFVPKKVEKYEVKIE